MNRVLLRMALLVLALVILAPPPAAHAQGLAALAVATSTVGGDASSGLQPKPGCWGCQALGQVYNCQGGYVPGSWNCSLGCRHPVRNPT